MGFTKVEMSETEGTLDYMPSFKRQTLFDKEHQMELESFTHSPKSARLTEVMKQLTAGESQETYRILESICGEYLKDVEENLTKAIETDSCRAEMDILNGEVVFLRKVATQKNAQLGAANKMLTIKSAEMEVKNSEIARKDEEIERLKQELDALHSKNNLLEKHAQSEAANLTTVKAHLRSWLRSM